MDVHISLAGKGSLSAHIYRQLFDAIVDGRLRPGECLPPTRELARQLDVSRNTVALAYERLIAEGVLVGRLGAAHEGGQVRLGGDANAVYVPVRTALKKFRFKPLEDELDVLLVSSGDQDGVVCVEQGYVQCVAENNAGHLFALPTGNAGADAPLCPGRSCA